MNKKTGFTLAEVLITLMVIGAIAALTVPALLQRIQEAELRTAWKKSYSDLRQAVARLVTDKGGSLKGNPYYYDDLLRDAFLPYLSYSKSCDRGTVLGNCWVVKDIAAPNGTVAWAQGTIGWIAAVVLNNGSTVFFHNIEQNCDNNIWSDQLKICGELAVDVNGIKEPNLVGKDIFFMWLTENNLVPSGSMGDIDSCGTGSWKGCSSVYLYQ